MTAEALPAVEPEANDEAAMSKSGSEVVSANPRVSIGNCRSLTKLLERKQTNEDDYERFGLTEAEIGEARSLFKQRLLAAWKDSPPGKQRRQTLRIDDMDLVMRQLRVFVSIRFIWALFLEIDENDDGTVDQEEFMMMVAKLRGRRPLSSKFYVGTLPRKLTEQYSHVFRVLDQDNDGFLDQEGLIMGLQQLNPGASIDQEKLRGMLASLEGVGERHFPLKDFLLLQAKCRRPPPAVDAALLNFTPAEREKYERGFMEWRDTRDPRSPPAASPQELRALLGQLGHPVPLEQVSHFLEELHVERGQPTEVIHLLFILASIGAGSCVQQRPMIWPGSSYDDAREMGFPLDELWDLGYDDLALITKAGYSAQEMYRNELADVAQLRRLGFRAAELRKSAISARELSAAGYSLAELRNAGFSAEVLRECCGKKKADADTEN